MWRCAELSFLFLERREGRKEREKNRRKRRERGLKCGLCDTDVSI